MSRVRPLEAPGNRRPRWMTVLRLPGARRSRRVAEVETEPGLPAGLHLPNPETPSGDTRCTVPAEAPAEQRVDGGPGAIFAVRP